jgi:hypothetical protein
MCLLGKWKLQKFIYSVIFHLITGRIHFSYYWSIHTYYKCGCTNVCSLRIIDKNWEIDKQSDMYMNSILKEEIFSCRNNI